MPASISARSRLSAAGGALTSGGGASCLQLAVPDRVADDLRARRQSELAHDVRPMRLGRADRDEEELGDLLIRVPERQQAQHLALAVRQGVGAVLAVLVLGDSETRTEQRVQVAPAARNL